MTEQELMEMIKAGKEAAPWANAVRMSVANAKKLGMPAVVSGLEVIVMDEEYRHRGAMLFHSLLSGKDAGISE